VSSRLRELLDVDAVARLAGPRSFERGEQYAESGAVGRLRIAAESRRDRAGHRGLRGPDRRRGRDARVHLQLSRRRGRGILQALRGGRALLARGNAVRTGARRGARVPDLARSRTRPLQARSSTSISDTCPPDGEG